MYRTPHVPCISCSDAKLAEREQSGVSYLKCEQCAGIWMEESAFQSLMEQTQPGKDHSPLVHNDGSERRPCPICTEKMDIAWILFLQLDRCEEHGIWFDTDELERAIRDDVGGEVITGIETRERERKSNKAGSVTSWALFLGFFS